MFKKLIKKIKLYNLLKSDSKKLSDIKNIDTTINLDDKISNSIKDILNRLESAFDKSSDFITREISIGKESESKVLIAYIDGLANKQLINNDILRPLMLDNNFVNLNDGNRLDIIKNKLLSSCDISEMSNFKQALDAILSGDTMLFLEDEEQALKVSLRSWDKRSIEEPPSEAVIRGPREGFTETLQTNTALLRRKIKNTNLKFETLKVGEQTNTDICICYMKNIANEDLIINIKDKISKIKTDAILESGYIEEFIEEHTFSIFPTVGHSEKPDIIAAKILEGRIAILCDGTPFVLTVPYLFVEALQSSEDYYNRSVYSVFSRFIRLLALIITALLPAYYVALVCFHHDIIPYKLLLTMTASREGIPFSAIIEALSMVVTFELLREAGVRMPRAIGQAVSIVGALVIGDAAVKAGLISTPMVIVIAITAITSFIAYPIAGSMLIIRIATVVGASVLGILGIVLTSIVFFICMCSTKSFGVNYLSPITPMSGMDLKDTFVRFPLWAMITRPKSLTWENGGKAKFRNNQIRKGK